MTDSVDGRDALARFVEVVRDPEFDRSDNLWELFKQAMMAANAEIAADQSLGLRRWLNDTHEPEDT